MSFTFIAGICAILLGGIAGTVVSWLKGPLVGMATCFAVLLAGLLGYLGIVTLAMGM